MKQNNQSISPKNYFRKSESSFLKSFVYLAFGFYNLARRGYNKLTKNAVLAIYFASVALLLIGWKSHTNLTHPGKYFRPSKVKIMRPTSPK